MNSAIVVALLFLLGTTVTASLAFGGQVIVARMNAVTRRRERQEDQQERQKVRERVEEAARLQVEQNRKVAASTAATNDKLEEIHVAVNSNLDQAQREALEAKEMLVLLMEEIMALKRVNGIEPSDDTTETLKRTRQRVTELRNKLHSAR